MADSKNLSRYIILPARGMQTQDNHEGSQFLESLSQSVGRMTAPDFSLESVSSGKPQPKIKVLDSIHENGAKLVELAQDQMMKLRLTEPGIRIVPEVFYHTAEMPYPSLAKKKRGGVKAEGLEAVEAVGGEVSITVTADGTPMRGIKVIAFTDFAARAGAQGVSNASGVVKLTLPVAKIERLFALPDIGFWPFMKKNVTVVPAISIALTAIDFAADDCVRHFYGRPALDVGTGVKVRIIDSGWPPIIPTSGWMAD